MTRDLEFQSGTSKTFPKQCSALRKGEFVMLKGKPCKIVEMSTYKTGKHGRAKVHIIGVAIFDRKKVEEICPSTHNVDVPEVSRGKYLCIDVNENYLSLMEDNGETKNDIRVDDDLAENIRKSLDDGNDAIVTVLNVVGQEMATGFQICK